MTDKHPYISGNGALIKCIEKFRNSIPSSINSKTLKQLGLAPNNESYLMNTLKFVGIVDENDKPTEEAKVIFSLHENSDFEKKFTELIKKSYGNLYQLHKEKIWDLEEGNLISYFRATDQTSANVGKRQAVTFKTLAALGGHGSITEAVKTKSKAQKTFRRAKKSATAKKATPMVGGNKQSESDDCKKDFGLTVRIEVNLPANENQTTYDMIFKSIKENLLNG